MMLGSIGYTISPTQPYFTPDTQQFVMVYPTNGMAPYEVETTESYLQSNLVGQMQNSGQYVGWTQAQWIAAFTADAVQRCASYPESCAGTTPQELGQKYGTLAYQIMQQKLSNTVYAPPPPSNTLDNVAPTPVTVTPAPSTNVLTPPTQTVPPSQLSNGTATGTATNAMPGLTSWLESNWVLLAAGLAALAILPGMMGGRQ